MPWRLAAERIFLRARSLAALALELGLVEARDRVPDVRLVVDREVLAALLVDVRELVRTKVVSIVGVKRCHGHTSRHLGLFDPERRTNEVTKGPVALGRLLTGPLRQDPP